MWRAFFLALGGTLCVLGIESLVLDRAVLAADVLVQKTSESEPVYDEFGFEIDQKPVVSSSPRVITPPEWAPWSLLSAGTVILLYAAVYKRQGGE